jgi:hypothetical protein
MAIFIWILASLVVLNVLLLVFSNSLRSASARTTAREKTAENRQEFYDFKAVESELKKAV